MQDLERFAIRHHAVLANALSVELRQPPSDSSFPHFIQEVVVAALCVVIRDWTIARIPGALVSVETRGCLRAGSERSGCSGPTPEPGGGHWSVIIGYDATGFFINDPYGNGDLLKGGYLSHHDGAGLHYSFLHWLPRWQVAGTNGWMLTCRL